MANPIVTGASGPVSETTSTQQTYVLSSNATISGSGTDSFTSTDSTAGDFITVETIKARQYQFRCTNNVGANLTTSVKPNIALISAGTITSAAGKVDQHEFRRNRILPLLSTMAIATGQHDRNRGYDRQRIARCRPQGQGVTVTGTATFGVSAISMSGVIKISTSPVDTITSGSIGINAQSR